MPGRIAITGAAGQLGRELVRAFSAAGHEVLPLVRPDFDLTDRRALERLVAWGPDVVVNSAAWTDVDGCAGDPERAMRVNGEAAGDVARAAAEAAALIVQISTNEVFDGSLHRPYVEDDEANPINAYGASKLAGERLVAVANPRHLIVRTAWLFGPGGSNFVTKIRAAAERMTDAGQPLRVVDDEWGNPTPTPWLADTVAWLASGALLGRTVPNRIHVAGTPPATRLDWAQVSLAGHPVAIKPIPSAAYERPSRPPLRAVLDTGLLTELGGTPGDWHALTRRLIDAGA